MAFETSKFDLLYGRILSKGVKQTVAKQLAATIYRISEEANVSTEDILKYINSDGLRFDNRIYDELNKYRTNSSQIGYLDPSNIPPYVTKQVV